MPKANEQNEREALWNRVDRITGHQTLSNRDRRFLKGILDAPEITGHASVDGRLLRGYVLYHFASKLDFEETCEADLVSVLRQEPDNATALLYLGHHYF